VKLKDYEDLMIALSRCVGRELKKPLADAIRTELKEAGWDIAKAVIEGIVRERVVPSNLYGHIVTQISEHRGRLRDTRAVRELRAAAPKYNTLIIAKLMFDVIGEIQLHHDARLVNLQPTTIGQPYPDIIEWYNQGSPKTWSPLLDAMFTGYLRALRSEDEEPKSIPSYLLRFKNTLVERRAKQQTP
jgi:hypothetical protein